MTKVRTVHRCQVCASASPRWVGRCPGCGEFGTMVEEVDEVRGRPAAAVPLAASQPVRISDVDAGEWAARSTGLAELDRVLGGGLVPGSVTVLGGEPGMGKSTLLLQALAAITSAGERALLVTAEESAQQVRLRAERLGALAPELFLLAETALPHVIGAVDEIKPALLAVDSIQTVYDPELSSAPGSVAQVRECAAQLVQAAKQRAMATVLVGHVTKEGALAGPRVLEHVVDTVLAFEGDRHHGLRLLRAAKHRFGSTAELGVFEMGGEGLTPVADPSALFLGDRRAGTAGSAVVAAVEGSRPLLVEVQALLVSTNATMPRRGAQGIEPGRMALLLAVLQQRCGLPVAGADIYVSAVGGVRLAEPGADLGVALALVSSHTDVPLPDDVVACGEVGLGGEVRQVAHLDRRLSEAARLGFRRAIVPASTAAPPPDIALVRVRTLGEAIAELGVAAAPSPGMHLIVT